MKSFFLLNVIHLISIVLSNPVETPARLCVVSNEEFAKCTAMKDNFSERNLSPGLDCIKGTNGYDCMLKVEKREADLIPAWFMDMYVAGKYHGLIPLLAEKYSSEGEWTNPNHAVAIVRKDSIDSLEALRGKKSCHSGVHSMGGWFFPASVLLKNGLLPNTSCFNNVANFANFFSQSCAPNAISKAYDPEGKYKNMCALCSGNGNDFCTNKDPYGGYVGAVKCLVEGGGDVAFVIDTTWDEFVKEKPEFTNKANDFELLCSDGSRKTLDKSDQCNLGSVPPKAFLTSPQLTENQQKAILNMFLEAQKDSSSFNLFESQTYGRKNLIFNDDAVSLISVGERNDYRKFAGEEYISALEEQYPCSVPSAKWCTISDSEYKKCLMMRDAFAGRLIKPELECVQTQNTEECLQKMENCEADLITLDGGDIYTGGKKYGTKPFMYENRGKNDAKYYAVAVVKKSNPDITYNNLQGKKSCHTGIGRTAGWNVPIGSLLNSTKITRPTDCDFVKAAGQFFSESCAPGALDPKYNPLGTNPASLCELCAGTGSDKCSRTDKEPYYGYTGAFRCMVEGRGDVAFIKHLTVLENTDGKNPQDWAKDLKKEDFELLCRDGTRKPIDDYDQCNLAKVPTHAVVTCGSSEPDEIKQYQYLLSVGHQEFCVHHDEEDDHFHMFESGADVSDLLFDDDTVSLENIPADKHEYRKYLDTMLPVFDSLNTEDCQSQTHTTTTPSTSS